MFWAEARRERRAARWLAHMHNEGAAFDRAAFEQWRGRDPANARLFDEMAATWRIDFPSEARAASTQVSKPSGPSHRATPRIAAWALAASLVAAIVVGSAVRWGSHSPPLEASASEVAVPPGQTRAARLPDGSVATLSGGSRLQIAYTQGERRLTLLFGQARFDVAHDATRPFRVFAGHGVITAHGTVFDVRVASSGIDVVLVRGSIDVARRDAASGTRRLAPGDRVHVPDTGPISSPEANRGSAPGQPAMLEFEATSVGDAIAAFNARNARQIDLADARVAMETVTGGFHANDPEGFARMLATMFDLHLDAGDARRLTLQPRS